MLLKPTTIYVNADGNVLEQSRKTIYRYSDINEIRLVTPLAVEGGMRINFLLSNGVTVEQKTMTALTEKETVSGEEWNVWSYRPTNVITATLTAQSVATLQLSFTQITVVEGQTFGNTFGTTTLTINPTIEGPEPTLADATALDELQSDISDLTTALTSKVDENLSGYTTLSVIDEDVSFVYVYYNGASYKVSLQQWINLVNTQFTTLVSRVESLEDKVDQDVSIGATPSFNTVEASDVILRDATSGHKAKLEYDDANNKVVFTGELSGGNESFTYDINQSLKTTDDVTFDQVTATTLVLDSKNIAWNAGEGTFDIALNGESLQVGQELHFYGKAVGAIAKGDVVMFTDQQGDHILFTKATGAGLQAFPQAIMGVATTAMANNEFGYVSWFGRVRDLTNTTGETWEVGDILYASVTTGQLTKVVPTAPDKVIQVAAVITVGNVPQQSNIKILVRPHFIEAALLNAEGIVDADYLDSSIIKGVSFGGTTLTFTKVDDTTFTVSLADLSEDAELISSGALVEDGGSKFLEFTRQNNTTFRINVDAFFDDTDTNKFVQSVAIANDIITFTYNDTSTTTLSLVGLYEPAFTKNSAFNKNFTTSGGGTNGEFGTAETVARGDHFHSQYITFDDVETLPSTVTQEEWDGVTAHVAITDGNPHGVEKGDLGLGSVDNTSDADKPVSTLQQVQFDKVNNATEFITATNSANSDFQVTLTNGLTPNAILTVKFPATAIDDTQQARLSIDGGVTHFIIRNSSGSDLLGSAVTNKTLSLVYNSGISRFVSLEPQEIAYTAFGWGDHASEGYLTSFTETDPVFVASPASAITATNISNWNTAYGWGDHAQAGYLTTLALGGLSNVDLTGLVDGQTIIYDDATQTWVPGEGGGGASVTVSETAPAEPADGDLWYDSTLSALFIYYNDGNSAQWVEVTYQQDYAEVANYTTTIAAADTWTDQTGFFTLAKTVTGITADDKPIADLDLSAATVSNVADIQTAWATIYRVVATANTITFYALEDPTFPEDTAVSLQVVR